MAAWSRTEDNTISRDEAIGKIESDARAKGYNTWKVFYNDVIVETPDSLPERVDYSKVRISAVLNQA